MSEGIEIGLLREDEATQARAVADLNFSEPADEYYRQCLFSIQGVVATFVFYIIFNGIFQPTCLLSHAFICLCAFTLHAVYLYVCLYLLDGSTKRPDLDDIWFHWNQPHCRFLVARDTTSDGLIIGTIAVKRISDSEPRTAELFRLRVIEGYENRGIGHRLNEAAERIAKEELKCSRIELLTYTDLFPKAPPFYERRGYQLTLQDTRGAFYPGLYWKESSYVKDI